MLYLFCGYALTCGVTVCKATRSSEKESRKKDRSRSKSPFRSFRWKKSAAKSAGPASDDEGNLERAERTSPGDEEPLEGNLVRKHEWETATKKASNRSWDKVFCLVRGTQILFYKDSKSAKSTPEQYFQGESPMNLDGATIKVADDYTKKKHVFRIRFAVGAEFLFQAHDDAEMNNWVSSLNRRAAGDSAGPSRSQTLPASGQKDEPKRRSFFTLKKV